MRNRWSLALGFLLIGCMPEQMTAEDELSRARAAKAKHPERWKKLEKISAAEATKQERKRLEDESAHNQRMIAIQSGYRCG